MTAQLKKQPKNASPNILGAARAIALREGAGKITIDAVARESGLSKGGVLYNFPTKKAVLAGLLDEMLAEHRERLASVPEGQSSRTLRGHLETVLQAGSTDDDLSMAILAVSASDPNLLDPLRRELSRDVERIRSDAQDDTAAIVLLLAIQGLRFQRLLRLADGDDDQQDAVIDRLKDMIDELE